MPAPTLRQARDEAAAGWYFDRFLDQIEADPEAACRLGRVLSDAFVDRIEDDPDFAHRFLRVFHRIDWPVVPPSPPLVRLIREEPGNMLVFEALLSPTEVSDVELRELELVIDDGPPEILDVTDEPFEFRVPKGARYTIRHRDTDADGNISEWSRPFADTARDTLAPPRPAAPTARLIREEPDEPDDGGGGGDAGAIAPDAGAGADGGATAPDAGGGAPAPDTGGTAPDAGAGGAPPAPGTLGGDAGTGAGPAPAAGV